MICEGLGCGKPPTCEQVIDGIPNEMTRNPWRHAECSWFDD